MKSLPHVLARCSPATKVKLIDALHRRGRVVAMTGKRGGREGGREGGRIVFDSSLSRRAPLTLSLLPSLPLYQATVSTTLPPSRPQTWEWPWARTAAT